MLADLISYRLKSGQAEICEKTYKTLESISKDFWNWRAFSFTIDYQLGRIKQVASNEERGQIKEIALDLSNLFVKKYKSDQAFYTKATVLRTFGLPNGKDGENEETVLETGIRVAKNAPKCALRLADILFDKGEFSEAIKVLRICCGGVFRPQPDISAGYAYLLLALSKSSELFEKVEDFGDEVDEKYVTGIYNDFHTAISNGLNEVYKRAAGSAIKTIKAQTGLDYPYQDADINSDFDE